MITCKLCDGVHGPSGCPARSATDREGAGERDAACEECERLRAELEHWQCESHPWTNASGDPDGLTPERVRKLTDDALDAATAHVRALLEVVDGRNVLEKTSAADAARRWLAEHGGERG